MKIVTSADFEAEVLNADKPVVVDFFATWCGPCKILAPTLDKIANERSDDLKIVKVDVDASPELAAQYGVRSMPTLMIFKDGTPLDAKVGADRKANIEKWINNTLSGKRITLSAADKKRLTEAFNEAVNASPDADKPTSLLTPDGSKTTMREAIQKEIKSGQLFKDIEMMLNKTQTPLDEFINGLKRNGVALPKPPQP